jgi:hypothetical protein
MLARNTHDMRTCIDRWSTRTYEPRRVMPISTIARFNPLKWMGISRSPLADTAQPTASALDAGRSPAVAGLWQDRSMDGAARRRAGAVGILVVGFAVLLAAASAGPVQFWHAPPPPEPSASQPEVITPPTVAEAPPPASIRFDVLDNEILEVIATVIGLAVAGSVAYAVVGLLLSWLRARGRRDDDPEPGPDDVDTLPDVLPPMALDVDAHLMALNHGSPRNAIVACWLRLEEDVAAAGLPRRESETSAEFTTRILGWYSLDPAPIDELAALYREARFSRHEMGQSERDRALVALRRIHGMLAKPSPARQRVEA